jgi:hypothetical protein
MANTKKTARKVKNPPDKNKPCAVCDKIMKTKGALRRHLEEAHADKVRCYRCLECGGISFRWETLQKHLKHIHKQQNTKRPTKVEVTREEYEKDNLKIVSKKPPKKSPKDVPATATKPPQLSDTSSSDNESPLTIVASGDTLALHAQEDSEFERTNKDPKKVESSSESDSEEEDSDEGSSSESDAPMEVLTRAQQKRLEDEARKSKLPGTPERSRQNSPARTERTLRSTPQRKKALTELESSDAGPSINPKLSDPSAMKRTHAVKAPEDSEPKEEPKKTRKHDKSGKRDSRSKSKGSDRTPVESDSTVLSPDRLLSQSDELVAIPSSQNPANQVAPGSDTRPKTALQISDALRQAMEYKSPDAAAQARVLHNTALRNAWDRPVPRYTPPIEVTPRGTQPLGLVRLSVPNPTRAQGPAPGMPPPMDGPPRQQYPVTTEEEFVPNAMIRTNIGCGNISAMIPMIPHPPPLTQAVRYGPAAFGPSEIRDNGIFVSINETRDTVFGRINYPRVIRVENMTINDPRLRHGFYVPPQWALGTDVTENRSTRHHRPYRTSDDSGSTPSDPRTARPSRSRSSSTETQDDAPPCASRM